MSVFSFQAQRDIGAWSTTTTLRRLAHGSVPTLLIL